ncbi:MAG TPA: phosphatase PAP2 family protein [Candidatus Tectomicrobia bacterium]|nr:phosphatase PAP2 family protein [Candidatus Tectomicrobia bacterium]
MIVAWLRQEGRVLLLALGVVLAAWAFLEIADEVTEGDAQPYDERILEALRRPDDPTRPRGPGWLVAAAQDVTALGGPTVLTLAVLAVLGYLVLAAHAREAWLVAIASGGGLALSTALKMGFARDRPDVVPHLAPVLTASFPSGHTMVAAVVYLTLGALLAVVLPRRRVKAYTVAIAFVLVLLIGISRVYLGVHYPSDVLAGLTAGLAWALLCWFVARWLAARRAITPGRP